MPINKDAKWYQELMAGVIGLSEELGLDDMSTEKLRDFTLEKARSQYMAGNKSGIKWMRSQIENVQSA